MGGACVGGISITKIPDPRCESARLKTDIRLPSLTVANMIDEHFKTRLESADMPNYKKAGVVLKLTLNNGICMAEISAITGREGDEQLRKFITSLATDFILMINAGKTINCNAIKLRT